MSSEHVTIHAKTDAFPLHGTCFNPSVDRPLKACAVIHCATGVSASLYKDFALWLAQHDIGVLTYDYRYTGLSWPSDQLELVVGPKATEESRLAALRAVPEDLSINRHWFERDAAAAIQYAADRWPGVPMTCLGHSLGGVHLPMVYDERPLISRYLIVTAGNRWVGNHEDPRTVLEATKEYLYIPLEKERIFYGTRVGMGEDLPYGIGKDWIHDLLSPRGSLASDRATRIAREMSQPMLTIGFENDGMCPKSLTYRMMAQYGHSNRNKLSLWINPSALSPPWPSLEHVKHFLPSRSPPVSSSSPEEGRPLTRQETIWTVYLNWILHGKVLDQSIGEFKRWGPDDEFDPLDRAEFEYSLEEPMVRRRQIGKGKL